MSDDTKTERSRCLRCRFSQPQIKKFGIIDTCTKTGKIDIIDSSICETCKDFVSKYIEYPVEVSAIHKNIDTANLNRTKIGKLCKVRPADSKNTYIGIFLGNLPIDILISHSAHTKVMNVSFIENPAIFVPTLNKIVYGYESWWRIIDPNRVSKDISDDDIENVWYMKLAKMMYEQPENNEKEGNNT